ncbi:MAG: GlsB/YeaQ/YmgE family stress response membrane protein [bacterium]
MNFVLIIVVGAAAGFLATRLMRIEASIPATIAIGIGGAMIGGVLIRVLLEITGWMAGFVGAVLGALFLLWIWKTYIAGR